MNCLHCHREIPNDAILCSHCGHEQQTEILQVCSICNRTIPNDAILCPYCGQQVERQSSQPIAPLTFTSSRFLQYQAIFFFIWCIICACCSLSAYFLGNIEPLSYFQSMRRITTTTLASSDAPTAVPTPLVAPTAISSPTIENTPTPTPQADSVSPVTSVWTNLGPKGGIITSLAIDQETPTTIYVGRSPGSVLKSADGGENWNKINTGFTDTDIVALTNHPIPSDTLCMETENDHVFKSVNGGETRYELSINLANPRILTLVVDPQSTNTLYIGTLVDGLLVVKLDDLISEQVYKIP
ncbi:MAG: hypothetical protein GY832_46665 [Chloroflexi bacterium]|nr:hypothetical protein [Chloroflexota bacterium]